MQFPPKLTEDKTYKRPAQTYTEKLQGDEEAIKKKLEDYEQISNEEIENLHEGMHLRYFVKTEDDAGGKNWLFRVGGFLIKTHPEYITLHNKNFRWNVKRQNAVFFRKVPRNEKMEKTILQQNKELQVLREKLLSLEKRL